MNIDTINSVIQDVIPTPISAPSKNNNAQDIQKKPVTEKIIKEQDTILSLEDTKELTVEMNEIMDDLQTSLGFSIREELNHQVVVEITNRDTNEVVKQIPSEELLTIKEKMEEFTGLLFDQSV